MLTNMSESKKSIIPRIGKLFDKDFIPAKFVETGDEIINPDRGWYQIHTFKLGDDFTMKDREYTLNSTDTLAFLLIDISKYRTMPLDELAVSQLRMIFNFFRDYRLDMIVRVVYDTVGRCMETEPDDESVITGHMNTLGPILKEYSGEIYVYQGLLIGNWGEMHSSKFLSPNRLKRLADVILEELKDTAYLAVRRPAYVRILFPEGEDVRQCRVGLFDDAILASPTHMGTFGSQSKKLARREQSWQPDEEMEYVSELCDRVPYGGEALWSDELDELTTVRDSLNKISDYMKNLHLSYLNRVHDMRFIDKLKTMVWTTKGPYFGLDGYEYIGRHLGYRLVIRKTEYKLLPDDPDNCVLSIYMENVGYSRAFFKSCSEIRGKDKDGQEVKLDVSEWMQINLVASGETHVFNVHMPKLYGPIYLYIYKESTKRAVYPANVRNDDNCRDGEILLGEIRK